MTLIDLLTVMLFVIGPTAAWSSAKGSHAGIVGYAVAVSIGVLFGAVCVWLYRKSISQLYKHFLRPDLHPTRRTEIVTTGVWLVMTLICLFTTAVVSAWASAAAIRFLG